MQILEHCYQKGIESYVVFEDDAIFKQGFDELLTSFLAELPSDWEQVYLGGQLLHESQHPPDRISDHVYRPYNVNRTHCFAVHQRGYAKLYKHLNAAPFAHGHHIDHHLGLIHETKGINVYCPHKWIVGQDAGSSNISGRNNAATYWTDPEKLSIENRVVSTRPRQSDSRRSVPLTRPSLPTNDA
jgi:GR25 family glycosyltransferase involved in LPS biosynthesis